MPHPMPTMRHSNASLFTFEYRLLRCVALLAGVLLTSRPVYAASTFPAHHDPRGGTLQSVENARVHAVGNNFVLTQINAGMQMHILFSACEGIGLQREQGQWWVLPTKLAPAPVSVNTRFWILPQDPFSKDNAWQIQLHGGRATATPTASGLSIAIDAPSVTLSRAEARPHEDLFGQGFSFQIDSGTELENALAAFYWGTMLPSVAEKTFAAKFPYSSGYVLSTLDTKAYAGSYPAVDHEFQIKGRLAMGTQADLDIVRRMIELQFKLMQDDPERLSRSPTSVQPDGRREYHIRRDSKNAQENAAMFPLTANIEVIEESWLYTRARKDAAWLQENIENLEKAAGWTLQHVDQYGRVWSDVYYEDQVIKDGRETEAQAFAAKNFSLLGDLEDQLGRHNMASFYRIASQKVAAVLIAPLPLGYWESGTDRFVDWVDRNSQVHDHLPLLANTLPVTFGYASALQAAAVQRLVERNAAEFERFPSFVAANIAAYTNSEMGTAGPYDLSAAGRYWFWDAAYRDEQRQGGVLLQQLQAVAEEARHSGYFMGERYDMDHIFYVDGKNAHGATQYYEYPNVYAWVLIHDYLGVAPSTSPDVQVAPHLQGHGVVELEAPLYALRYRCTDHAFSLTNLATTTRSFRVDLTSLYPGVQRFLLQGVPGTEHTGSASTLTLAANQTVSWTIE